MKNMIFYFGGYGDGDGKVYDSKCKVYIVVCFIFYVEILG